MSGGEPNLGERQLQVLTVLLRAPSVEDAALESGLPESAIRELLRTPDFQRALYLAQADEARAANAALQGTTGAAVGLLREIVTDERANRRTRLAAACSVGRLALASRDHAEFDERLRLLQIRIEQRDPEQRS